MCGRSRRSARRFRCLLTACVCVRSRERGPGSAATCIGNRVSIPGPSEGYWVRTISDQRRLTSDEWNDLIRERDTFKLAIRGQTAIEAEIDAAVADALVGPMPRELQPRSVRFELRLAMAVGPGVMPPDWQPMFAALATLRNDFAHGKIRELGAARARELFDTIQERIGPVQPDAPIGRMIEQLRNGSPREILAFVL